MIRTTTNWHVYVLWLGSISQGRVNRQWISRCQGHSLTEIKTFLSIKVIRHNAITDCASGNAWADVSRSSIRFTYSSVARHIEPCICHNSQTYTWNDVIPHKGRMIRVFNYVTWTKYLRAVEVVGCGGLQVWWCFSCILCLLYVCGYLRRKTSVRRAVKCHVKSSLSISYPCYSQSSPKVWWTPF